MYINTHVNNGIWFIHTKNKIVPFVTTQILILELGSRGNLCKVKCQISSVRFSRSVVSDSLQPYESQQMSDREDKYFMVSYSMWNLTITTKQLNSQIPRADLWLSDLPETEETKERWQEQTEELYKKVLMTGLTMMEQSLTQSQTSWSVKSSGLQEALL